MNSMNISGDEICILESVCENYGIQLVISATKIEFNCDTEEMVKCCRETLDKFELDKFETDSIESLINKLERW